MARRKFYLSDAKTIRTKLNEAINLAEEIHRKEQELIQKLYVIDKKRYYVFCCLKSLSGFCLKDLGFSKTQTQRIVTQVRRYEPTAKIEQEEVIMVRRATARTGENPYIEIKT